MVLQVTKVARFASAAAVDPWVVVSWMKTGGNRSGENVLGRWLSGSGAMVGG